MEEWIKEIKAKKSPIQNQIYIECPTIGWVSFILIFQKYSKNFRQIDAMDGPDDVEESEEKPSTSKQAWSRPLNLCPLTLSDIHQNKLEIETIFFTRVDL